MKIQKRKRFKVMILFLFVLSGCASISTGQTASLTFISHGDFSDWAKNNEAVEYAIALTNEDIVRTSTENELVFNLPVSDVKKYEQYIIQRGIKNEQEVQIDIKPGTYDWLVLLDTSGDGSYDSYVGTLKSEVPLNEFNFVGGKNYKLIVQEDTSSVFITE